MILADIIADEWIFFTRFLPLVLPPELLRLDSRLARIFRYIRVSSLIYRIRFFTLTIKGKE